MPTAVESTLGRGISIDFLGVLDRIGFEYGGLLTVLEAKPEWIKFTVSGMPNELVMAQLEGKQSYIFGANPGSFQVLCPWLPDGDAAIYLHHLSTPALQSEYAAGVWFY